MLRAAIVDNELIFAESLRSLIVKSCPEVVVSGIWMNVDDAVKGIREQQPEIVFLDVELNDGTTGFNVLEKIQERNFEVIFITAFNKYAARAFRFSAVDFLEKPVDEGLLREAVGRVKKKKSADEFKSQLQVLTESFRNLTAQPKQIILPNPKQGDSIVVPVNDVIRIEASGSQAIFFFRKNGQVLKTMYSLNIGMLQKKMLQGNEDFIMIHESHMVNRNHITHYNSKSHAVQMDDDTFIRIAARRVSDFLQKFNR
ncbi:MAG TPA: LytTR family DNA-binding domain-containing protein [Chitinophagales bacterium]|nr:LytTR family DNA-binding domain-containing protein [Chitinophagales bacterium]